MYTFFKHNYMSKEYNSNESIIIIFIDNNNRISAFQPYTTNDGDKPVTSDQLLMPVYSNFYLLNVNLQQPQIVLFIYLNRLQ